MTFILITAAEPATQRGRDSQKKNGGRGKEKERSGWERIKRAKKRKERHQRTATGDRRQGKRRGIQVCGEESEGPSLNVERQAGKKNGLSMKEGGQNRKTCRTVGLGKRVRRGR